MATKIVELDVARFIVDGSASAVTGKVLATPTKRLGVSGNVILPAPVPGVLGGTMTLQVNAADWGWIIDVRGTADGEPVTASWCVTVLASDPATVKLSDLTEVDRKTFHEVAPEAWSVLLTAETNRATAAEAALDASIETQVEDAAEVQMAGLELAYGERLTNFQTTTLALGTFIPEFTKTIVGQGRRVDVKLFCTSLRHSVAGTQVSLYTEVNGSVLLSQCNGGNYSSPSASAGRTAELDYPAFLADGVPYTFKVGVFSWAAGTATLVGAASTPMSFSIISR